VDADILGSGVAFPLRVDRRGGMALVRAGEDITEAITIILGTAPGERPMRPEFGCGIHNYIFETVDAYTMARLEQEIRIALDRWEPRIDVLDIDFGLDRVDFGEVVIEISYVVRTSNDIRNLVYPFYIIPAEESE
jgi:phage baseplate assembly protein W